MRMGNWLTYPEHARALYEALRPDPYFRILESLVEGSAAVEAMLAYYDYSMREAETFGELYLPPEQDYGVSIWLKPLDEAVSVEKTRRRFGFIEETLGKRCLETYVQIMEEMSRNAAPLVSEDAWYLSIVGVLPEFQGMGKGGALIAPVLAHTDRLRIPTYLETFTPRNRSFYKRLGYLQSGVFDEPTTGAEYALMIRPAVPR